MSIITDEMVEAAARAAYERRHKGLRNVWGWEDHGLDDEHPGTRERFLAEARAALAAVAPRIAAAEREACALVADSRATDMWEIAAAARDEGDQDRSERMTYRGNGANSVAAAIRARQEPTP